MVEFKVEDYHNLEEYNYDYGFDISESDFKLIADKQKEVFEDNENENKLFDKKLYYVVFKNGKMFFGESSENISTSFYVGNLDNITGLTDNYYIVKMDGYNRGKAILENKNDYGVGLFELIIDVKECKAIVERIKDYDSEQKEKFNLNWWGDYFHNDFSRSYFNKYDYEGMTKQEVIDLIMEKGKSHTDKKVKQQLLQEQKQKEEQIKYEEKEKKLLDQDVYEEISESKNSKTIYEKTKCMITYYSPLDKPQIRFKFKSRGYLDSKGGISLNNISSFKSRNKCKNLAEQEISFKYEEYNEERGHFEKSIEWDFETSHFNGIKVAGGKMMFFINRVADDYYDKKKDISKYRNEDFVKSLNRLSGIKVDVCSIEKIHIYNSNSVNLNIPISISMVDRETFEVEIFNEKKIIEWVVLKEKLTSGSEVHSNMNRGSIIRFVKDIGISEENIKLNLDRLKMLEKLKGNADEKNK